MSTDRTPEELSARAEARWHRSHIDYLEGRERHRVIEKALAEGGSRAEIAAAVGVREGHVDSLATLLAKGWNTAESAYEVITRAHVEGTPRRELIDRLAAWPWPEGGYPFGSGVHLHWYPCHRDAILLKLLTREEIAEIDHMRSGDPGPYVPYVPPRLLDGERCGEQTDPHCDCLRAEPLLSSKKCCL